MAEYTKEEIEAGYTYDRVNGKWEKRMIPKEDLPGPAPKPKTKFSTGASIRYRKAATQAAARGEDIGTKEEWAAKNLKKDEKSGCFLATLLGR